MIERKCDDIKHAVLALADVSVLFCLQLLIELADYNIFHFVYDKLKIVLVLECHIVSPSHHLRWRILLSAFLRLSGLVLGIDLRSPRLSLTDPPVNYPAFGSIARCHFITPFRLFEKYNIYLLSSTHFLCQF
jgi:hypothetical protein